MQGASGLNEEDRSWRGDQKDLTERMEKQSSVTTPTVRIIPLTVTMEEVAEGD